MSNERIFRTKFIWKIENFNFMKDTLSSPTFPSHSGWWEVKIIPTSYKEGKYYNINLNLCHWRRGNFNCSFTVLDSDGTPVVWREKINESFSQIFGSSVEYSIKFDKFIKRNEIFGCRRSAILPNNILTVQCLIWKTDERTVQTNRFARTRIEPYTEVVEKSFIWNIENARSFTEPQTRVEVLGKNGKTVGIKLSLKDENEFVVTFKALLFRINFKIKISVMDPMGKNFTFLNDQCQFEEKEQEFDFRMNITKNMLKFYSSQFLQGNTLSLQFTCVLSGNITFHQMVNEDEICVNNPQAIVAVNRIPEPDECAHDRQQPINKSNHSISQALQEMFEDGFLSDCILRIGSAEYPIHKAVLGARSEVFKAMFTTDMKEKDGNCVDIQDVDEETLRKLLRFVYSDSVEGKMGSEDAARLYAAADKYALESLKLRCSGILNSELCLSNALQVLTLADMHQDQHLKSAALKFISRNNKEVVGTERWLKFEEENGKLALETLRKLYLQKVDGY